MTLSSTAVERAIAQCTSRWAMARGHRLNTSIVLAAVHGLSGLFRAVSAVEPITLALFPTLSPSLIGHPASVDVKQHKSQKPRIVKQYKCQYCCSCKNYRGKGMKGEKKKCLCIVFWLTRRSRVHRHLKMRFGASMSNKLLFIARHILTSGLQK